MSDLDKILNNLLAQFGAGSKDYVYVCINPSVGLEMIQVDPVLKIVKAYGRRPLEYNEITREISDYDEFRKALEELFKALNISSKCNVILTSPTVYFGKVELPLLLNDESVTGSVISEVEQVYLFKKCEPVVSWFESISSASADTRTILYSAIQKPVLDKIKLILTDLGATLAGFEPYAMSILRALAFTDLTKIQMVDETPWNLMVINSTGYSIFAMSGKHIIDYVEEPLALKTYELEEVYTELSSSIQLGLLNFPTNYLYIISETDLVSAEHLSEILNVEGTVNYLENNSFKKNEILQASLNVLPDDVMSISLEAVGIAVSRIANLLPIRMDFSGNVISESSSGEESISFEFNGQEITLTEETLKKMSFTLAAVLLIPALTIMLILPNISKKQEAALQEVNDQISELDTQINSLNQQASTTGTFVVKTEIENVVGNNRKKLLAYSALGESVTQNLWLTYFKTKEDGKVDIKGVSENVEDIYVFFKNLKDFLLDKNLRLYKLEMASSSLDDVVSSVGDGSYQFEITNMSDLGTGAPQPENNNPNAGNSPAPSAGNSVANPLSNIIPNKNENKQSIDNSLEEVDIPPAIK